MAAAARAEALSLARTLLRTGRQFPDYNIREYVRRRVLDGFREHARDSDGAVIQIALKEGRDGLQMVQRQLVLYSMYTRTQSIMDLDQPRPRR